MNYVDFKEEVITNLRDYLPEEFRDRDIEVEMVPKVNGFKEALMIRKPGLDGPIPNIYLDQLYEQYQECGDIGKVLKFAAEFYEYGINYGMAMARCMGTDPDDEDIVMMLVNTANNSEMLKDVPHRSYLDLAVIYRWLMPLADGSFNMCTITNEMAKARDLTEEKLYALARDNTRRLLPPRVESLGERINVLTNDRGIIGAAVIMYEHELENLANMLESDLYVIPSSIHEVITVPVSDVDPDHLAMMISDANRTVLKENDILSDNLYQYRRDEAVVTMVREDIRFGGPSTGTYDGGQNATLS